MLRAFSCSEPIGVSLTPDEFARSLRSGRGNAVLHLQTHDAAPYRDVILNACLHCVAFDPQSNGDRADYLFEVVTLTGDVPFYRERILAALPLACNENYDRAQVFDLAARFAAHGDEAARSLLYATYIDSLIDAEGTIGDRAIIELDGVQGFLFVADALGKLLTADATDDIDEMPMYWLKDRVPDADLTAIRTQAEHDQPYAAAYIARIQAQTAERERRDQERNTAETMPSSFDELESLFTTEIGKRYSSKLVRWGKRASDEDRRKAAEALIIETDPARQIAYARLFSYVPFPLDPAKLITMAESGGDDIMRAAVNAIGTMQHPELRALALRLLAIPQWGYHAGKLLVTNHEDGDETLIMSALIARLSDEDTFHDLGLSALNIFEAHPGPQNLPAITLLYEHEPCSFCRGSCIRQLIALDAFADWMIAECLHDGEPDTREQTREYLRQHLAHGDK